MINLDQLLLGALYRSSQREWTVGLDRGSVSFSEAVESVARVLAEHLTEPDAGDSRGQALVSGLFYCNEIFGTIAPARQQVEAAIQVAQDDYGSFCALNLLLQISAPGTYQILDDWKSSLFLGLVSVPPRPRGRSKFVLAQRDAIMVGQINQLDRLGFKPTRNNGSRRANDMSGCDVVSRATERVQGVPALSYDAVERVWKMRNKPFFGNVGNEFLEAFIRVPD